MTTQTEAPSNQFGITFADPADVPPAPQRKERNTELYQAVKLILSDNPGRWVVAKVWDNPNSAQATASQIRTGNNKLFPPDEGWTARSKRVVDENDKTKGTSTLFIGYKVSDVPAEADDDDEAPQE